MAAWPNGLKSSCGCFPVHPTYLEVFEAISVAEKREVLKTLSAEIKRMPQQRRAAGPARTHQLRLVLGVSPGQCRAAFRPGNPGSDRREQGGREPDPASLHPQGTSADGRAHHPRPVDPSADDRRHPGQDRPDRRRTSERPVPVSPRSRRRPATSCEPPWKRASKKS